MTGPARVALRGPGRSGRPEHVGRDKVYYLLRTGQLRSIKIGKLRRITDRHLAEFVNSLESPSDNRDRRPSVGTAR